jgi:thiamine-monophosphate kinase
MELTKNELLKYLKKFGGKNAAILRGIGDDAAVVRMEQGSYVFTQDAMVEHVHFDFVFDTPFSLGKKVVSVNVSDVLSMGARPLYFLVTLGVPATLEFNAIQRLYQGMSSAAKEFKAILVGGDITEGGDRLFVDISMVGKLVVPQYLGRNGARPGDLLGVTGELGEASYGRVLLEAGVRASRNRFITRYLTPVPPFETWKRLVDLRIPHAMVDVSDGLLIDLERMMLESGTSAVVYLEDVPVPREITKAGKQELALAGQEDYQLLFSFGRKKLAKVEELKAQGFAVSVIGEVKQGKGVQLFDRGAEVMVPAKGYEHFRRAVL